MNCGHQNDNLWALEQTSVPAELPLWKGAVVIGLFTAMAFPLVGLTLLAVLIFDLLLVSNTPAMKRAMN